jgi:signal peptidase II
VVIRGKTLTNYLLLVGVLAATIGCDRVTKRIAVDTLVGAPDRVFLAGTVRVRYAENTGGFLSVGAGLPPRGRTAVFIVGTGVMLLVAAVGLLRYQLNPLSLLGATLFVAGGASHWIDRVTSGRVVDFLNVGIGPVRTGIFNIADMAILAGLMLMIATEAGLIGTSDASNGYRER